MTDDKKEGGPCPTKCDATSFYVSQLGGDLVEAGNMGPVVHAAAAIGLLVVAGAKSEEDAARVIEGVLTAVRNAAEKAKGDENLRKSTNILAQKEANDRKKADPQQEGVIAMQVAAGANTTDAIRRSMEALKAQGLNPQAVMVMNMSGEVLHTEGDIPTELVPPGAKAPAGVKKH